MSRGVTGVLFGLLLIAIGVALAFDYRRVATRHIEFAMRVVRPITPFRRRNWTDDRLARRKARFVVFDRLFGLLMIVLGAVALVSGAYILTGRSLG